MMRPLNTKTQRVYLGVGSNIDREYYIRGGLECLGRVFGRVIQSSVYESEAFGFKGDPFYNLVVSVETALPIEKLVGQLKRIEFEVAGRSDGAEYRARKLDIDLLLCEQLIQDYGSGVVPRADILRHEYVLRPLAEIAPEVTHPLMNKPYRLLLKERFPNPNIKRIEIDRFDLQISA